MSQFQDCKLLQPFEDQRNEHVTTCKLQ